MVRKPDKVTLQLLRQHLIFLKKKFKPEQVILFGSRARGDNLKESDIDIMVISKQFALIPFRERMAQAYGYWNKRIDLEQICYTPEEVEVKKKQIGIVQQALKEGIRIL